MTSADTTGKVTAARLRRDAYLYIRQSTLYQVANNTESTARVSCVLRKAITLAALILLSTAISVFIRGSLESESFSRF
jgi:hypothetical protein